VEPEDVVHVLGKMVEAVETGGVVLDLAVIRPKPRVECDGCVVCEFLAVELMRKADAAAAAVNALVAEGRLVEEAVHDHDVLQYFDDGPDLLAELVAPERSLPAEALPILRALHRPCRRRDRCRLRRLRVG
jgi:ferredoxin